MIENSKCCTILWDLPSKKPDRDDFVFSFLSPLDEHEFIKKNENVKEVITMSRVMDQVSVEARNLYIEIVADIGLFKLPDGRTIREALRGKGKTSLWWYHPISFRNSEWTPTYTNILSGLAIAQEANNRGINKLHLVSPPKELADVLKSNFKVTIEKLNKKPGWYILTRMFLSRVRFLYRTILTILALKLHYKITHQKMEVTFQGFWDWSVFPDDTSSCQLSDTYFGKLPAELRMRGKKTGYWCWYEPKNKLAEKKRIHHDILKPLQYRDDVVLLNALLTFKDIIAIGFDFSALVTIISVLRLGAFEDLFKRSGLNFYRLFYILLIQGILSSDIPLCRFFELTAARAQTITQPKITIRFQEHNPQSRAVYAAMQKTETNSWAIQHASYNSGKTFLALHPFKEFTPQGDEQSVPNPDRVCVMGELGKQLFGSCGYNPKQIMLTGSPRYDHVQLNELPQKTNLIHATYKKQIKILVASSLPARADFLMIEAAVEAVKELNGNVSLRLRQHPHGKIEKLAGYSPIKPWINVSKNTLNDDLNWADLVLVGQSTVGEEAFLAGKQVWQFRFPHPNQSALAEVARIPQFYTVSELSTALHNFRISTEIESQKKSDVEKVYHALFQKTGQIPSKFIAQILCSELNKQSNH